MTLLRTVGAIATIIIGLVAFAIGVVVAATTLLADSGTHHPIDWETVMGGGIAMLVGVGFMWISRAVGGDHGPIRSYPSQRRKGRSVAARRGK